MQGREEPVAGGARARRHRREGRRDVAQAPARHRRVAGARDPLVRVVRRGRDVVVPRALDVGDHGVDERLREAGVVESLLGHAAGKVDIEQGFEIARAEREEKGEGDERSAVELSPPDSIRGVHGTVSVFWARHQKTTRAVSMIRLIGGQASWM